MSNGIKALILAALAIASLLFFSESVGDLFTSFTGSGEALTLEVRYTPEEIMRVHKQELLSDTQHTFEEPRLSFHPYLLMEVKYTQGDGKTREGAALWSLIEGEMVLNTDTWETTHGFHDAILAEATSEDFQILNALSKSRGSMSQEELSKELTIDAKTLDLHVDSAKRKQLVIQKGGQLQLHFQNPKLLIPPQTRVTQYFVNKPFNRSQRHPKQFSNKQVERVAKAAFGRDFTIRRTQEVYLPVYTLVVQNPDGSLLASEWNAINGRRIPPRYIR